MRCGIVWFHHMGFEGLRQSVCRLLLCILPLILLISCRSTVDTPPVVSTSGPEISPLSFRVEAGCRLMEVQGDTRGVATGPDSLAIVGQGIGVLRSFDSGETFLQVDPAPGIHWPSICSQGGKIWISWVSPDKRSVARVAVLGKKLHQPVDVFSSWNHLIDTEILALQDGTLLLLISEVEGKTNCSEGQYRIHCFYSADGGISWEARSQAVSAPWGINIEDPRLIQLENGRILLAYEWEEKDRGSSRILIQNSEDAGRSWSAPSVLWDGRVSDREPGSFFLRKGRLYFVGSSDNSSGRSYAGARLGILQSSDGGESWRRPIEPIREINQLSMGAVVLEDRILLLSLRFYLSGHPVLHLYPLDPLGLWRLHWRSSDAVSRD